MPYHNFYVSADSASGSFRWNADVAGWGMPVFDFRCESDRLRLHSTRGHAKWRAAHYRRQVHRRRGRAGWVQICLERESSNVLGLDAEGIYRVSGRKTGVQQVSSPLSPLKL